MITAATRKGNQAYWRGYAEADYDIAANGIEPIGLEIYEG